MLIMQQSWVTRDLVLCPFFSPDDHSNDETQQVSLFTYSS